MFLEHARQAMMLNPRIGLLAVAVLAVVTACGRRAQPQAPVPQDAPPVRAAGPTNTGGGDDAAASPDAAAVILAKRTTLQEVVHFDYDRSDIRQDAAAVLTRKLPVLREDAAIRLRIEGHADERGSIEYNLALGMRRAQAVKDYLANFGVDATRLQVASMGEDRPADPGRTEAAYARNRRAEFAITAGLEAR
jgi:peptidoglycan-associated lipoprotein